MRKGRGKSKSIGGIRTGKQAECVKRAVGERQKQPATDKQAAGRYICLAESCALCAY